MSAEECKEQQSEELEVLQSIYEGDENFKQISDTVFQYKYEGEEGEGGCSFILEIGWPELYPTTVPNINMEVFHNNQLPQAFKDKVKTTALEQAEALLDEAMTFSLFDYFREEFEQLAVKLAELVAVEKANKVSRDDKVDNDADNGDEPQKKKEKKEQLTKRQKQKLNDRTNFKGEMERGWDWIDIIKHLSQTANRD